MSKHTPGPWNWRFEGPTVIVEPIKATITILSGPEGYKETQEANARLIAAAPEMLEALKTARPAIETWILDYAACNDGRASDWQVEVKRQVETAIRKAGGE